MNSYKSVVSTSGDTEHSTVTGGLDPFYTYTDSVQLPSLNAHGFLGGNLSNFQRVTMTLLLLLFFFKVGSTPSMELN